MLLCFIFLGVFLLLFQAVIVFFSINCCIVIQWNYSKYAKKNASQHNNKVTLTKLNADLMLTVLDCATQASFKSCQLILIWK